jgi:Interferon-induced transmembrane protein.
MKYYIAENGQPAGPFEPSELMAHGLTVNSLVWGEGMPNWVSASQVPELVAMINGTPFNPGGIDTQMPQMPPMGGEVQLPQVPPFGGQQPTQPTPYGTPNQPYAPPQYGPSTNQPSNQVMPKTWLTEAVLVTVLSFLCLCNIIAAIPGGIAIFKANSVKTKYMQGDIQGANAASASAKKWVIIAVIVMVVWSCVQGYQLLTNPNLLQQIQEGSIGSLYGI